MSLIRIDLGLTSKASSDHVPLFTDYLTFPLVLVVIAGVVLSFIAIGAPEMERQAKVQQESAYVVRR